MELNILPIWTDFELIHDVNAVTSSDDFVIRSASAKWEENPLRSVKLKFNTDDFHSLRNMLKSSLENKENIIVPVLESGLSLLENAPAGTTLLHIEGEVGNWLFLFSPQHFEYRQVENQIGNLVYIALGLTYSYTTSDKVFRAIESKPISSFTRTHPASTVAAFEVEFLECR
ncbi:MAG: hypothetical protein ACTSWW_10935 [Promethearchaeota archaeon]